MKMWGKSISSVCLSCNKAVEDNKHILSCQVDRSMIKWDASVVKLNEWLDASNAYLDVSLMIINIVVHWTRKTQIILHEGELVNGISTLFKTRKAIG